VIRHYRAADGCSEYYAGDVLICDDTGEAWLAVAVATATRVTLRKLAPDAPVFTLVVAEPHPDDEPASVAHLAAELGRLIATANRAAIAARDLVRRDRGPR
jgi:hypothetical protein